ncbi:integrator complex subunit 8 isoform X3 [Dunckerocampus dactyliophorus]|uniref:integrator complex subunit 8 isoform X3 n=1 Tax=Dunckerocampus dactyliophorus TaxID=161453 RepID=UPI002404C715|nr:integrator complex subunit 8 isoform X3 [Dunckerocampus dactyliophorus]
MAGLRCRIANTLEVSNETDDDVKAEDEERQKDDDDQEEDSRKPASTVRKPTISMKGVLQRLLRVSLGCLASVACGMLYAAYLSAFHERRFWFSTRQELEREITFQGGSGLYYYYYKHMLAAPSFQRGFYELMTDDRTLAGQTINAVERLSLYPEMITSYIYRITGSQDLVEPIYFYMGAVFGLQAVYATALFVCSWLMSGTWVAGVLAVAWCVISRSDATRVDQAVPLRENWALPYYSCQVAALTGFLCNNISSTVEMLCYLTMSTTTFSFLLVWEHSHHLLFIQAFCLFLLDSFDLVPPRKMSDIHKVYVSSLLLAFFFHFHNTALLGSPLLSLLIGSMLARYLQKMKKGPLVARVMKLFLHFHLVFAAGITFNYLVKKVLPGSESEFILKFLEVKFGLNTTTDFVTNLLLCQESLRSPSQDLFLRLTQASVLPFYLLVLTVCLLSTLETIYRRLSGQVTQSNPKLEDVHVGERPEVVYHVFHTFLFGGLTMLFDGVKYVWTPYVCMFTAFGVCSPDLWMTVFRWMKVKSIHPVMLSLILSTAVPTIIGLSLWREYCPRVLAELSELQEFSDLDAAEMISWIRTRVPTAAVFAGSPQLLGAVKLGSGLVVTSLPHHSDMDLLRRSEDVSALSACSPIRCVNLDLVSVQTYQVYSMRSAEEIYKILTSHKTNYVIIEESLCNELSLNKGCRIKDLLDISNGHRRMSAEAADRVAAVTSSRPSTPLQTSWFEFLLDGALLEKHLQKSNADPTPVQLIVQFLEQASKPSVNEQNQVQPPADNRRNRTLKLLALKVAAHMKWDLDVLEKGSLSIPVLNMLLNELLCVSKVPPGVKHVDLDLSTLPPTTAMAVLIYNRWAIRTIVLSSFPEKQAKPGPHQMNMLNVVQQEKEMTDNILSVLKEQASDSISVLTGALQLKKDFYVHTMRTLDLLAADGAAANGETESSTAGLRISANELHCQVHYDLGAISFQQGCRDQPAFEKARDHFRQTKELLKKLDSAVHVHLDEKRLAGYWNACQALTGDCDSCDSQTTRYDQINMMISAGSYQAVVDAFIKDNVSRSLPKHFRCSVLREFLHKAQQGEAGLDEVCHKLCVCNAVRDALEGEVLGVRFLQLLLKPSKRLVGFILEVCTQALAKERSSETSRRNMATFVRTLCESLEDVSLVFVVSSHKLFTELLKEEERTLLVEQMRKRSATVNLSAKPLPSFYDIPVSASVSVGQLEQQLILSLEPRRIRQILNELHGIADRPFWRVNSKWEVPPDYINVILAIKDNLTKDLVYILMAKGLHCISVKDFLHARQLFSACLELVTEFSPRLRQVMLNEMLLLELRAHETVAAKGSKERPPPDLISRVRGYLEMRIHDLPLRQVVGEECVAFMLNWRENDYLTLQVPSSAVISNPYIKLGQLLASTCKELPGPKESRRTAKELWDVVVQICSVSIQHKRSNDGRVGLIKHRESSLGILLRSKFITFVTKIREPLVLTTLISLFVRLHCTVRDDIVNEVTAEHLSIWPSSLPNIQAVDVEAVAVTVKELVTYALTLNPNNQSWLITQADIYFVTNQYSAALNFYVQAGAVASDFFSKAVPPDIYTDQVLKRMIKCCSMMNCHTQVAVLCQFLREVDYMTAFKALQEQSSHDAMDSFYDYIWDVTILEYLTHIHHKRGEAEKRQIAIKAIGQTELNTSNPEEVLQLAAQKRKKRFFQAMAKLYF